MGIGQFNCYAGDLLTGRIYGKLPLTSSSWSFVMDDSGGIQATVNLFDANVAALNIPSLAAEAKSFLMVTYQDPGSLETPLQAGPVWNHGYDDSTGTLTITAAGMWSYWDHRKLIATAITDGSVHTARDGAIVLSGWALGTIAKKALQTIGARTNGLPPHVFQADEAQTADDAHTRTWNGYDLAWAGAELRNLSQVINGPEMRFTPRYQAADNRFIEWVLEAGTEAQPLLFAPADWIFDATVDLSPVNAVGVATDATGMGDLAWAKGSGSEIDALISVSYGSALTGLGYPLLEVEDTGHTSVVQQTTLDSYAQQTRAFAGKRLMTLTPKIHLDGAPSVGQYRVGDYVQLRSRDSHPYLFGQTVRSRIVQISGDDTPLVAVQLAPVLV